ncbi:hypothetical protein VUR80DRAFT_4703 [Thermomyces stellatus]
MAGSENKGIGPANAELSLATLSVHADEGISAHRAIAPAMHVSTTFRYSDDPDELVPDENVDPSAPRDSHMYSRMSNPNLARLEALLTALLGGPAVTYSSGLSAFHALLTRLNPRRISIGEGYHGCHGVIDIITRLTGLEVLPLDCPASDLRPGDLIHLETPLNPTGEAYDIAAFAKKARESGALLSVDATFAPPPLQDPFALGADVVMHSGTKYFGGHSDMLCGVLAVSPKRAEEGLHEGLLKDRVFLGSVMGSLEGWLGIRSLRTLELRVRRQSSNAERLVQWLADQKADESSVVSKVVEKVQHASLQPEAAEEGSWLRRQMPGGYGPVFALWLRSEKAAKELPSKLRLFHHGTSLGGVESLIEWRAMTDKGVDKRLLRVSVGVEGWEDLRDDLKAAFEVLKEKA